MIKKISKRKEKLPKSKFKKIKRSYYFINM